MCCNCYHNFGTYIFREKLLCDVCAPILSKPPSGITLVLARVFHVFREYCRKSFFFLSIGEFIFKKAQLFLFDHSMFEFSYTRFGRMYFSILNIYYSLFVYFFLHLSMFEKNQ